MRRITFVICSILILSGCAVPMTSQEMQPQFDFYDSVDPQKFKDNVFIRNVEVKKNVGGASPVTPEEYRAALVSAFRQADLYETEDEAKYVLDTIVSDMDQPFVGFNMTVSTSANYTIIRQSNGDIIFQEAISVPCTKGISDAFEGAIRLRLASGCSVGENITHLIHVLSQE